MLFKSETVCGGGRNRSSSVLDSRAANVIENWRGGGATTINENRSFVGVIIT